MVHHYTMGREEARDLTGVIAAAGRRALERLPGVSRRRIDDLPYAAVALRRLLRATGARRVVFSASGLREGWFMQRMPEDVRAQDPLLAAGRDSPPASAATPRCPRRCSPGPIRCSSAKPWKRDGCAKPPAGRRISAATTIRNSVPSRPSCACCASRASGSTTTPAPVSRWHGDALRGRARCRFPAPGAAAAGRGQRRTAPKRSAPRCGSPTRCRPAPRPAGRHGLSLRRRRLVLRLEEDTGVFAGESVMRRLDRLAQARA